MYDFEAINLILDQLAQEGTIEPVVEPIDEVDTHPMDFADATGLWDEMYPEPLDANDFVW